MNIVFAVSMLGAMIFAILAIFAVCKIKTENIEFFEKLCRNRKLGVIIGFPLVCWCVPHTQAIIFSWAEPYLWYAAVVLTVLSYFYLDYLFARALGGAFIIGAYCFVHWAYEFQVPGGIALTVIAWLWGICGICISAKPSFLRDYFRKCASCKKLKIVSYLFFGLTDVIFAVSLVGGLLK